MGCRNNNTQLALVFNVCIHIFCVLYLIYKEVSVCLSVVSYSRLYLWVNLDETLQDNPGAPSDEHGGSDVELSTLAPGVGVNILREL